jgi:hypothetical protein
MLLGIPACMTNSMIKVATPNPKPQTPNPKPQTPNPKPQTSSLTLPKFMEIKIACLFRERLTKEAVNQCVRPCPSRPV